MPSFGLSSARAEASRRNGAKSRGPKTREGKARSAQNALKHGLCAQRHVVLPEEDAAEFAALEAALIEELAPEGVLQSVLVQRIVAAAWRLSRAERIEVELFAENGLPGGSLGLALMRDGRRAGAFHTLVRYRGGAVAEFWRALRTLQALQVPAPREVAAPRAVAAPQAVEPAQQPRAEPVASAPLAAVLTQQRNEPEPRGNHGVFGQSTVRADGAVGVLEPAITWPPPPLPGEAAPSGSTAQGSRIPNRTAASLLAATALVPAGGP